MRRKKKVWPLCFVLFFLLFLGIMDYPYISRSFHQKRQEKEAEAYVHSAGLLESDVNDRLFEAAVEYNRRLSAGGQTTLTDAFLETRADDEEYLSLLDTGNDGVMALLEIPQLSLSLPVYHGTSEEALQKGAGHLEGSSLPVGGMDTHACILAHRGLPDQELFTGLDQLEEGDVFSLRVLNETLIYEVYMTETVTPDRVQNLAIRKGEDLVTLITCTPYGINTHRLYVHGRRVPDEGVSGKRSSLYLFFTRYGWIAFNVQALIWMCFLLVRYKRKEEEKKDHSNM